jgi:hypothetical protein
MTMKDLKPQNSGNVATRLFNLLKSDKPIEVICAELSPAMLVDYGIEHLFHLLALRIAVENGATRDELEAVKNDNAAISAFVAKYAPKYTEEVVFTNAAEICKPDWDEI